MTSHMSVPDSIPGRRAWRALAALVLCAGLLMPASLAAQEVAPVAPIRPPVTPAATSGPVIENAGQFAPAARFVLNLGTARLWLTDDALWLTVIEPPARAVTAARVDGRHRGEPLPDRSTSVRGTALRITFPGRVLAGALKPFGPQATHISYLLGTNRDQWHTDVPAWSGVRVREVATGVDLVIDPAMGTGLTPWRLEAQPGAQPATVRMQIAGALAATLDRGQVVLQTNLGALALPLPAYADTDGAAAAGSSGAVPVLTQVGADTFEISPAYADTPAVGAVGLQAAAAAAPGLVYGTYMGGTDQEAINGLAVDASGHAYVIGDTYSIDLPTSTGAFQTTYGNVGDAFVAKLTPDGSSLVYMTYLGGNDLELGAGIAVEETPTGGAQAYVMGDTFSTDFPGTGGVPAGNLNDIFVASLNRTGTALNFATLYGGDSYDYGYGIAVENSFSYIAGRTDSTNLTTAGCSAAGEGDILALKLDTEGALAYATCLGGTGVDAGYAIAVRDGSAYVAGETHSSDFPGGGFAGVTDAVVAIFGANGDVTSRAVLGDAGEDYAQGIALDATGHIYMTGGTFSALFPLAGSGTACHTDGSDDAFVAQYDPGLALTFSTCLGGTNSEWGDSVKVGDDGILYLTGVTASDDFPLTADAFQLAPGGGAAGVYDAYAAHMDLASTAPYKLTYATYLGGSQPDLATDAAIDGAGNLYVAGLTYSADFPVTPGAHKTTLDPLDPGDGFVVKLGAPPPAAPLVTMTADTPNVTLSWDPVTTDTAGNPITVSKYEVWQSTQPYFTPSDASSPTVYQDVTALPFLDPLLTVANAYFYVVRAVSSTGQVSSSSNQVAQFTFELVKGQ